MVWEYDQTKKALVANNKQGEQPDRKQYRDQDNLNTQK